MEGLKSDYIDKRRDATEELFELTKHENITEIKLLIVSCGVIKPLVSMLLSEDIKIQENAVNVLKTLSFVHEYRIEIAKADAILPLIRVLKTGNLITRANSATVLGELSRIENSNIKIGGPQVINSLVELLNCNDTLGNNRASYALYRLSQYPENNVSILQAGAVKHLVNLMDSSTIMFEWIVGTLWHLARLPYGRSEIWRNGGIQMLVKWLHLGSNEVKCYVVAALLELCLNSNLFCEIALQEGAIQPLVALIQSGYYINEKVNYK